MPIKKELARIVTELKHRLDAVEQQKLTSESLCSRRISAIVPPKFVRMTRLKLGRDTSCVRHALTPSEFMPVPPTNDFTA